MPLPRVANLETLVEYQPNSIVSRTVTDKNCGTVTLFSFAEGQNLSEHTAPFDAMLYVIDGEADLEITGEKVTVKKGEFLILPANLPHTLKAVKKFKMLLTMIR